MQLEHSFTVPVGIEDAWHVLLDIEQVAPCMPGAALESVDGDDFTGSVKVKLGPISLTYKGKASFVEKDAAAHRATIDAQGRDSRGGGTAAAKVTASLAAEGASTTRVNVITDLNITGKPAQFGRGVMVDVGNKLIGQFADCLAGKLAGGNGTGAAAAAPAAAGEAAAEPAAEVAAEVTADAAAAKAPAKRAAAKKAPAAAAKKVAAAEAPTLDLVTEPTAPAPSEPAVEPAAEPTPVKPAMATPSPRSAPQDVEPIDLMASAGPAVAKRLAPVLAVIAVVVAILLGRRRRNRS